MFRSMAVLAAALSVSLVISSCGEKFKPTSTDISGSQLPSHESWNSNVIFSDSSITKAVLKAGKISVYSEGGFTLVDSGAVVEFYSNGVIVSTLKGGRGKVNDKTKDIEIYDSVSVVSKDSVKLFTDKLFWNNASRMVSTNEFVRIRTPEEEIQGYGFESDQSLSNYRIFKVSGTFTN